MSSGTNIRDVRTLADPPVVGKYYRVPCIQRLGFSHLGWWPVIGEEHDDKYIIGVKQKHYHPDIRFLSHQQFDYLSSGGTNHERAAVSIMGDCIGLVQLHRRKCRRDAIVFPLVVPIGGRAAISPFSAKLEDAYEHARMKCMTCPHRGFPLNGQPVIDGVVTCPGHGLAWNVSTGELVRRTSCEFPQQREAKV